MQVPVSLESSLISPALAEAIGANESSLTMLPLYKRCLRCRRFATYGIPGPYRRARHCKAHQTPSDKDVTSPSSPSRASATLTPHTLQL